MVTGQLFGGCLVQYFMNVVAYSTLRPDCTLCMLTKIQPKSVYFVLSLCLNVKCCSVGSLFQARASVTE